MKFGYFAHSYPKIASWSQTSHSWQHVTPSTLERLIRSHKLFNSIEIVYTIINNMRQFFKLNIRLKFLKIYSQVSWQNCGCAWCGEKLILRVDFIMQTFVFIHLTLSTVGQMIQLTWDPDAYDFTLTPCKCIRWACPAKTSSGENHFLALMIFILHRSCACFVFLSALYWVHCLAKQTWWRWVALWVPCNNNGLLILHTYLTSRYGGRANKDMYPLTR